MRLIFTFRTDIRIRREPRRNMVDRVPGGRVDRVSLEGRDSVP